MLKPTFIIRRWPPDIILPPILNLIYVANNNEFFPKFFSSIAAILVMFLNLPTLVRVKIKEVIFSILSLSIILISRPYLIGPYRRFFFKSLNHKICCIMLNLIRLIIFLMSFFYPFNNNIISLIELRIFS